MLMSNYPDNIRQFDNHPMSPFYVEPTYVCAQCNTPNEIADMRTETCCKQCAEEIEPDE